MDIFVRTDIDATSRDVWEFNVSVAFTSDGGLRLHLVGHYIEERRSARSKRWEPATGWRAGSVRTGQLDRTGPPLIPGHIADAAMAELISRTSFAPYGTAAHVIIPLDEGNPR